MGIRYYAYAFDHDQTEQALADPCTVLSADPLADAWGAPHGFTCATPSFQQSVPHRDMLYLDKAWGHLQALTASVDEGGASRPRPSHRMFEGQVVMTGAGWEPWVRTLVPAEIPAIARDAASITDGDADRQLRGVLRRCDEPESEVAYALSYLHRAQTFVDGLAADGRGMVYLIG
ncbi:hypothetical protein ASG73_13860 [Janibacter sp. Soil728]|uniref:hypothetical protein n=1 Tax=Janibacter sp. Soil728 TaxID=1736393 RepID=UPI0006FB2E0A|nr:hypothetical protein [Janibacter sp. Soil728]KRE35779.1 hypothetical protein ASG73_13860 [Janibacter sp. Soil728]